MEFTYQGKVLVRDLHAMVAETKRLMKARVPHTQLVNTLGVTSVPAEIGPILSELLEHYREVGGKMVVMVTSDKLNEMLGRSLSFGAGIRLEVFNNRPDAVNFVNSQSQADPAQASYSAAFGDQS